MDYLFRALFFETSGVFSLMNNITVNLEISSSFDSRTQKPNISISSFSVEYHTFNILFGGSIFGYLLDIIEGFCECVVKEQYPNLLQTFLDMSLQKIVSDINYKYLVDLNFTEVGLDIALPQEIENKADHLNIYLNALFYDPYSPYENPPQPTNLPIYNESHRGIEIAINQGTINSFLWALNHQEIFDILIKGDDLPIQLPFPLEINTKLFELALPELYTYYDSNKIIDLQLNSSKDNSPLISFAENYSSILLKINESITFLVRTDENIHDEAFTVNFLFDIQLNCSLNQTFLMFNVLNIRIDNSELVKNKIPNLQIQGLTQLINSTLNIAIGLLNVYLNENPISVPEIKGVKLDNLELLIKKDNLILAVEPTIYELYPESIKTVVKKLGKTLNMVKI